MIFVFLFMCIATLYIYNYKNNDSNNKKNVDKPPDCIKTHNPQYPENQKNCRD